MKKVIILFLILACVSTSAFEVRNWKPGDVLPDSEAAHSILGKENRVILFVNSGDANSQTFLQALLTGSRSFHDIKLVLVDTAEAVSPAVKTLLKNTSVLVVNDHARVLYGLVGVIVLPTALYVRGDHVLNSVMAGVRPNLGMFIAAHLKALETGTKPENPFKNVRERANHAELDEKLNQAFQMLIRGTPDLAVMVYKKAHDQNPESADAMLGLGYAYILSNHLKEAVSVFESLTQSSKNPRFKFGLYLARYLDTGSAADLESLKHYYQLEPHCFPVVEATGKAFAKAGEWQDAAGAYEHECRILSKLYRRRK